jgi:glycosyltransferase involved in cell wall biosynthesis
LWVVQVYKMSIGSFIIIKNEKEWIAANILNVLPYIDEMVFLDGNSTDGTLEIIKAIQSEHKDGWKIKLVEDQDPKDLQDDYVRVFNAAIKALSTDLAWFLHPDMYVMNPEQLLVIKDSPAVALSTSMRSFGGEPGGQLYEIVGRGQEWKNIYRNKNPDLGLHYFGWYGAAEEDCYFKAITGNKHEAKNNINEYPYAVSKSGLDCLHFSDVRPLKRRVNRMVSCLLNNAWPVDEAKARATNHPRVTFQDGGDFTFKKSEYPKEFIESRNKYRHLEKELTIAK